MIFLIYPRLSPEAGDGDIDFDLRVTLEDVNTLLLLKACEKGLEFFCLIDPEVPALVRVIQTYSPNSINLVSNAINSPMKAR